VNDKQDSGRPQAATDEAHLNHIDKMIMQDCCFSQQAIANKIAISHD
jgi:hypothetical protein